MPPAVSGFADDVPNWAAPVAPLPPAAVNGAGNGVVNGAGTGFADDVPFAADVGPVGGGAVNGAGGGLNLLPPVIDIEREVMEAVWMQVKGACEKLKEETNAQNEHIRKMLKEMADRYYS